MQPSIIKGSVSAFVKPDVTDAERERRGYLALCLLAALASFTGFLIAYSLDGRTAEARADAILIGVTAAALALNRFAANPRWALRLATAGILSLFVWTLYTGSGQGFGYVWLYFIPGPSFYLFGEREGSWWVALSFASSVPILLFDLGAQYPPALALRFTLSYGLVAILSLALERSRSRLQDAVTAQTAEVESAREEAQTLAELVPVCAWCRKVRDDDGYWSRIEEYLVRRPGTRVSHGLCPECEATMGGPEEAGS